MTIAKDLKRNVVIGCLTAFCALGIAGKAEARHHHKESKGHQAAGIIHAVADTIRAATGQGYVIPAAPAVVAPTVVATPTVVAPTVVATPTVIAPPVPTRVYGPHGKVTIYPNGVVTTPAPGPVHRAPAPTRVYGPHGKVTIYHGR